MKRTISKILFATLTAIILSIFVVIGVSAAEPNDSKSTATKISLNTTIYDNLSSSSDVDYFKFTTTSTGYVTITFTHSNSLGSSNLWEVYFLDQSSATIVSMNVGGNELSRSFANIGLPAGEYYIKVNKYSNYSTDSYGLRVSFSSSSVWETEFNDSRNTADPISIGTQYYGTIMHGSDYDYFKFTTTTTGYVTVNFTHENSVGSSNLWEVYLLDQSGATIVSMNVGGNELSLNLANIGLPASTYYVKINKYSSYSTDKYGLKISFTASTVWETEFNDSRNTANPISIGTQYYGKIMHGSDYDYYYFDLNKSDTITITFSHDILSSSTKYWTITLYDASGSSLISRDSVGSSSPLTFEKDLSSGRYYVGICKYSSSSNIVYSLLVSAKNVHTHSYGSWTNYSSTQHKRTCSCGNTQYENHSWNSGVVTTQPTHTSYGVRTYTCTVCGGTKTEQIAKTSTHSYGAWANYSTTQHRRTCACGDALYESHSWNSGTVTTQPTHTSYGVRTYTCMVCGGTKTEQIAKTSTHSYGAWANYSTTQHRRNCACGDVQYADHAWNAGVVTTQPTHTTYGVRTYTCSDCGATKTEQISPIAHSYGAWTKYDDTQHKRSCSCGSVQYANHTWNAGVVTTQPTHTTYGVKTYTCADCGATKTEQIAKLTEHAYGSWTKYDNTQHKRTCACGDVQYADHTWNAGVVTTQPTHTTYGVKTYTCADCGATKTAQIAKLTEHAYGDWAKENDEQHKRTCVCGDAQYANHTWNAGVVTMQPTHTTFGVKTYTCTDCDATKTEQIAKLTEHAYGDWAKENDEQHKRSCACGDVQYENHSWDAGVVTPYATYDMITYTCSICGGTKTVKEDKGSAVVSVENATVVAGNEVTIQVTIKDNPGIAGAKFTLSYDEQLVLLGATNGEAFSVLAYTAPGALSNPCNFLWDSESGESQENGIILELRFKVPKSVAPNTKLAINLSYQSGDCYNKDLDDVSVRFENAFITVIMLPGDVNLDGTVNGKDVTLLRRYIAGGYDVSIDEMSADVNDDGVINGKDVTLIRRYIAGGYDIELKAPTTRTYEVSYHLNLPENVENYTTDLPTGVTFDTKEMTATKSYTFGDGQKVLGEIYEISGWEFKGWSVSSNENVYYTTSLEADQVALQEGTPNEGKYKKKLDLYAVWELNS